MRKHLCLVHGQRSELRTPLCGGGIGNVRGVDDGDGTKIERCKWRMSRFADRYFPEPTTTTTSQEETTRGMAQGWRLSDKLYELSLEAEEEEKRQEREASLQAQALSEMDRERTRLRSALEEARAEARSAMEEAMAARDEFRDREEAYAKELVVLRADLARCRRAIQGSEAKEPDEDVVVLEENSDDETPVTDEVYDHGGDEDEETVETLAMAGDESGLRKALAPRPRYTRAVAYGKILSRALIGAAEHGQAVTVKLLLRRGALGSSWARRRCSGWTALHAAARSGSPEVVEALLASDACSPPAPIGSGALRDDPLDLADADGKTALMVAAEFRSADAARALLRAGADADLATASLLTARDLAKGSTLAALESPTERFWNASAAGNRAWRRKDFASALAHFSNALNLSAKVSSSASGALNNKRKTKKKKRATSSDDDDDSDEEDEDTDDAGNNNNKDDAAPSAVDLARLELNCAKAALRLGRSVDAGSRADAALERHRAATRGGVYANALAVRAECRENLYDFEGAAQDFDDLASLADHQRRRDDVQTWRDRAVQARDKRDATHYAVLGVAPGSDDNDIRKAYRKASMRWHPDRNKASRLNQGTSSSIALTGDPRDDRARAERHFRRINEAKETLLDSYKRAVYDVEHRRRLVTEADRGGSRRRRDDDSGFTAWPWHAAVQQHQTSTTDDKENEPRRISKPWKEPSTRKKPLQVDANRAGPKKPSPPTPITTSRNEKKPEEQEWSWRLREYEDELKRQRTELERTRAARVEARERNDIEAATRLVTEQPPYLDDDDDPEDLGTSLADALGEDSAFFAPRTDLDDDDDVLDDDNSDNSDDDDDDKYEFVSSDTDLGAQLRDAADWFDHLDEDNKGELDMRFFDELADRLGLRRVLGEEEMQRQRFFADPVGTGYLKRGAFLGWFAALLEGSGRKKRGPHRTPRGAWPETSAASA